MLFLKIFNIYPRVVLSKREHFPLLGKALEAFKVWPPKAIPWATRALVGTSVKD